MALYQINQSSYPATIESDWQNSLQAGDTVLLFEAGVLRTSKPAAELVSLQDRNIELLVRSRDALAYGLSPAIGQLVSDEEWVAQAVLHDKIISW